MKNHHAWIAAAVLLLAFCASTASMLHHRARAGILEEELQTVRQQMETLRKQPRPAETVPATPEKKYTYQPVMRAIRSETSPKHTNSPPEERVRTDSPERPRFPTAEERQARLEELKQTDPERYQDIMDRREKARENIQNAFADKAIRLLERDTSGMTDEELEQYERLLDTLDDTWMLAEQMTAPETPREERQEIRQELFDKTRELRPMLESEREIILYELGRSSGYSEEESEAFVEYINETYDATTISLPRIMRGNRTAPPEGGRTP